MIYDFHAHIYPEKIAARAVEGVSHFYQLPMAADGTVETLLKLGKPAGITNYIVHSVATGAKQVESVNDFIAREMREHPQELIGFGTLHPDCGNLLEELERIERAGLCGLKLHPDSQRFFVDDKRMYPVYDYLQGRLPLLVHCGDYRFDYDHPRRIRKILDDFPGLTLIAAHFGGWSIFDVAVEYLQDKNCYLDCSSSVMFLGKRRALELIRLYGAERMLFGSDYPMWNPAEELSVLQSLGLTGEELDSMLYKNAERILTHGMV